MYKLLALSVFGLTVAISGAALAHSGQGERRHHNERGEHSRSHDERSEHSSREGKRRHHDERGEHGSRHRDHHEGDDHKNRSSKDTGKRS